MKTDKSYGMKALVWLVACFLINVQGTYGQSFLDSLVRSTLDNLNISDSSFNTMEAQIILTQVNRDAHNNPNYAHYTYGLDSLNYYYPASTVKFPTAMVALEKIRQTIDDENSIYYPLLHGTNHAPQQPQLVLEGSESGLPSIAQYIKRVFIVSDNNSQNRMFEFCGQEYLNNTLDEKGYPMAITHRIGIGGFDTLTNQFSNPWILLDGNKIIAKSEGHKSKFNYDNGHLKNSTRGKGYAKGDSTIMEPFDFTYKNFIPLMSNHKLMITTIFPESVDSHSTFNILPSDYSYLYKCMGMRPRESKYPMYDDSIYYDGYVKFHMYGDTKENIPDHIRILNKVGFAYGFLTDVSYIIDLQNNTEFFLSSTVHVNGNQIYNDGIYEYDALGIPFMAELGRQIFDYESNRSRLHLPDLAKFDIQYAD